MTPAFWIWTHLSFVLLAAYLLRPVLRTGKRKATGFLLIGLFVLSMVPVTQADISGFVLAHTGTLSVPLVVLIASELACDLKVAPEHSRSTRRNANMFWLAAGAILYPSALGYVAFDTYRYGYQPVMSWCVLCVSIMAVVMRQGIPGFCLVAAVLAHQAGLFESPNLWDFLIDPWLCIAAAGQLCGGFFRRNLSRSSQPLPQGSAAVS